MPIDDELSEFLDAKAASIDVEPIDLAGVKQRGRRRNRRNRMVGVGAAFVLVIGASVGVRAITADDSGTDVAVGVAANVPSSDSAPPPEPTVVLPTSTLGPDQLYGESTSSSVAVPGVNAGNPMVVPWGEGFLSWSTIRESPTLDILDPSVADKFPPEIIAAVRDAGATTLEESVDALRAAGLLELATQIVTDDPDLLELYGQATTQGTTRFVAQTSNDGIAWQEIDTSVWPAVSPNAHEVVSDGSHLLIAESVGEGGGGPNSNSAIRINLTTDLETWSTIDLVPPNPFEGSPYVNSNVGFSNFAIGPNGWVAVVNSNIWLDIESLIPAGFGGTGISGVVYTADGVTIQFSPVGAMPSTGNVATTTTVYPAVTTSAAPEAGPGTANPIDTLTFTWEELGINGLGLGPNPLSDQTVSTGFAADWDAELAVVVDSGGLGRFLQIVGTDSGYVALTQPTGSVESKLAYSADGMSWQPVVTPGIQRVDALVAVDGGLVVSGATGGDHGLWLGGPDGAGLVPVSVPDIPSGTWITFDSRTSTRGASAVVDLTTYPSSAFDPFAVDFDVTIEQDGIAVTLGQRADGSSWVKAVDTATGEVVLDQSFAADAEGNSSISFAAGSMVIVDDAGDPIVSIPIIDVEGKITEARRAAIAAAESERPPPEPVVPDIRLVASRDGVNWLVTPAPEGAESFPVARAINGHTLVIRIGNEFRTFTLP